MRSPLLEMEGTWEEIAARAPELAGRRVRLTVLAPELERQGEDATLAFRPASGRSLLRHVGTWAGDDLKECLRVVEETRSPTKF